MADGPWVGPGEQEQAAANELVERAAALLAERALLVRVIDWAEGDAGDLELDEILGVNARSQIRVTSLEELRRRARER